MERDVEKIRRTYPVGCRIVLDEMDDPYRTIPAGTEGTVTGVDDIGSVMPEWDTGGSLSVAYGEDRCHKIADEAEAKTTLDHYGTKQPEADARCPRCGDMMFGKRNAHALSRRAKITVCDRCGMKEALEDAGMMERRSLMDWAAIVVPQNGGGRWKR